MRTTTPRLHERPDGVGDVGVVPAEPVDPAHHQRVAGAQQVEQASALWSLGEAGRDAGHAVVAHHLVDAEARGLGMSALVGDGLLGRRDPRVEDRLHGDCLRPL